MCFFLSFFLLFFYLIACLFIRRMVVSFIYFSSWCKTVTSRLLLLHFFFFFLHLLGFILFILFHVTVIIVWSEAKRFRPPFLFFYCVFILICLLVKSFHQEFCLFIFDSQFCGVSFFSQKSVYVSEQSTILDSVYVCYINV